MLGKLLKHEWIATIRRYSLFYLVLGAMTLFAGVMHAVPVENFIFSMGENAILVLYGATVVGVLFCSVGMAVVRFYKNMVSDEGYLTFTLPVKVEELVLAKFLVAIVWQLITIVMCVASVFLVFVPGHIEIKVLMDGISSLMSQARTLLPVFCLTLIATMVCQIMLYYLSMAVGQLFGNYKIVASVIAYCIIYFAMELVPLLMLLVVFGVFGFDTINNYVNSMEDVTVIYVISISVTVVMGIVEYFATCSLLKKKLNLV